MACKSGVCAKVEEGKLRCESGCLISLRRLHHDFSGSNGFAKTAARGLDLRQGVREVQTGEPRIVVRSLESQ